MKLNEIRLALIEVARHLREFGVEPVVYGSVGVSFYLGEYKPDYDDMDLLIQDNYLAADWSKLQTIVQKRNFILVDEHEHEFSNGKVQVAFAKRSILKRDGIADSDKDFVHLPFDNTTLLTLAPTAFLRAYEFSSKDGYRINQRHKKNDEVIKRLREYLMVTEMHLNEHPFQQIVSGEKTIELRLNDEKRSQVKVGDVLTFWLRPEDEQMVTVLVTEIHRAETFAELAQEIDVVKAGLRSKENLVDSMAKYYPLKEQVKCGVLGIEFIRLNPISLVVLMGLPGSGKSHLAKHLAKQGFVVVAGEGVALEMFGTEQLQPDQYSQVYEQVRKQALQLLQQGKKVVIDGTNLKREYRQQIYDVCAGYPTKLIYLKVDKKTALQRIKEREEKGEGSGCDEQTFADFERQLEEPMEGEPITSIDEIA